MTINNRLNRLRKHNDKKDEYNRICNDLDKYGENKKRNIFMNKISSFTNVNVPVNIYRNSYIPIQYYCGLQYYNTPFIPFTSFNPQHNPYINQQGKNNSNIINTNTPPKTRITHSPKSRITKREKPRYTKKVNIDVEIKSIDDLIELTNKYPIDLSTEYNINIPALHRIKKPLIELQSMIGMNKLKNSIVDQILYYIQDLHKGTGDFMHTCIYGPPGTGKTEIAKIMGKIFSKLGILKEGKFRKVVRSDLVAGYLGQTAMKTRDVIKDCLGGVMFIDEAYALGNPEKRDSFAKECIDTLCEALSDNKDNLMVIIAGYEDDLKRSFFAYNQGLDSRFTWRFKTDEYKPKELRKIFEKKVLDIGWKLEDTKGLSDKWFEDNIDYFKFYGRDMENLLSKVKISHSRRVFCLPKERKQIINMSDLEKGMEKFLDNDEVKKRKDDKFFYRSMYL
jgi:hypothetical protein